MNLAQTHTKAQESRDGVSMKERDVKSPINENGERKYMSQLASLWQNSRDKQLKTGKD